MYPTYPNTFKKTIMIGDKEVTIEIGKFSQQVSAAVLVTCGETIVHSTVALGRKVNLGYFPLSVDFAEKLYAAGTIKGSRWIKRDGRPLDDVILKARVVDRSLRPLFPDGVTHSVQIINTVFSYDGQNDPDMLGLLGSAIGLAVSEIPFDGPMAGLRIGYRKEDSEFLINPTHDERDKSDLDLIVAGSGDAIVMVEAGADEISEKVMVDALILAQDKLGEVCTAIGEIVKEVGKEKVELVSQESKDETKATEELATKIHSKYAKEVRTMVENRGRLLPDGADELNATIVSAMNKGKKDDADDLVSEGDVKAALYLLQKKDTRKMILEEDVRPDGRSMDKIREIWCETDVFPRTHGSAMFKRGATQGLTITTLGNPSLGQLIESINGEETRHYIHHYSMPPYASGEAGRFGFPKRREIGHGALAERALKPMIPTQDVFPYTIHVVSEIMSSNGSTSQASVCGSTLSLMAAGVPIKRPVSGIAMGLMSDGKKYIILSDIQGLEDHVGDMDFKVSGTAEGITAIQMDIKLKGIPREILEQALEQARTGRLHILDEMLKSISEPNKTLSEYAPKVVQIAIPQDRIGELIGPSGKNIKALIADSGADINVDEDEEKGVGIVNISSSDQAKIDIAATSINNMMRVMEVGEEFDGKVVRIENYGAFVNYLPGRDGLVHVSAMSTEYVGDPNTVVNMGDTVHVRIAEIKDDGKIGLSMLTLEEEEKAKASRPPRGGGGGSRNGGRSNGGGSRGGNRNGDRGGYNGGNNRSGGGRSGGYRR